MTEPIIINSTDISRCQYRIGDVPDIHCAISYYWNRVKCSDNPNCYYKQLKRKEQELNEIKNDIETRIFCVTCKKENENDKLRVECEELKAELATAKINYQELHDECAADYADYKELKAECEKYKKAVLLNLGKILK